MCIEDTRLGRKKFARVNVAQFTLATPGQVLLPADPNRTNFVVTTVDGSVCWISDKPMTLTGQGLRVAPNNTNLADFSVEDHGDFVWGQVFVWVDATVNIATLETSLAEQ